MGRRLGSSTHALPGARERLVREEAALRAAKDGGAPVPSIGELVTIGDRPGLVMERVDGPDLIARVSRRPWTVAQTARRLGQIHALVNGVKAPSVLIESRALLDERIAVASLPDPVSTFARRVLETLPDGDRLCHGDFHPGNALVRGSDALVIDWTNASRGSADSDVARTLLMLEMSVIPESTPRVIRRMAAVGRSFFRQMYVRAYVRVRSFDRNLVERGKIPHPAARCAEGIVEENPLLIRFVEKQMTDR